MEYYIRKIDQEHIGTQPRQLTILISEGGVQFPNGKKPESLISRVIEMTTNPGDLALDSFLGSGTTAASAHNVGRKYIGIEMGEQAYTHCKVKLEKRN